MAASTSAAVAGNASSSLSVTKKYDVFISFRGEDTRGDFTSHLHAALGRSSIETYIDYRIQKGEEVWVELVKAIKGSTLFLVIFSENYATSSWCLNELVELMECRKLEEEVHVIPVFYKIDPSQVRKQTGSYRTAVANQKWKDALYEAANLSGFHSHTYRTETDLIEDIIKVVLQKLNHRYTYDFRGLFISDENYTNIESLLKIDSMEVRVIGIWGKGGIGKTTLAAAIFHKVSFQYEGTCFLENVAEESKRHGLNDICTKLFSKLLSEDINIGTNKVIPSNVSKRLKSKKVFVVLDDVNTPQLLENLVVAGGEWLGAGSRVIVTTRDRDVLKSRDIEKIHEVKEMNFHNSLKLFSLNAFGKTYPTEEYEELSKRVMVYAKGIPLALKVLGSFLRSKSENEWDSALSKLKKIPNKEIQTVLRLSYDGLDDGDKIIFLDIACFFKGQKRDRVKKVLDACGFSPDIGIKNLLDKALITTTSDMHDSTTDSCIDMHDLIQEMGRGIVREESINNPGQRSRLWDPEEVNDVLTNNTGTDAVQGIWLEMSQIQDIKLSSKSFRKMPNLRLLTFQSLNGDFKRINSVYLPKGLEFLPKKLRYLGWNGFPLESLPSTFCPEKLVELSMRYSNVQKLWHGVQNLPNLEKIDLFGCINLMECPNLSLAPKLKQVSISHCESLSSVDPSILSLPKLQILNVSGCTSLKSLSSNTWSPSLQHLYLEGSGLNELPPSILHIKDLKIFASSINYGLMDLPENFSNDIVLSAPRKHDRDTFFTLHKVLYSSGFQSVTGLTFYNCQSLGEIPDSISLLSSLLFLSFLHSNIISLPESIKYLPRLHRLCVGECKMLRRIPALPQSIQCFLVWNCQSLQTVLSSMIEPSESPNCTFLLANCIKLDEHSFDAIIGEPPPSEVSEDAFADNYFYQTAKLCYSLPARSGKVREWFHSHFTQSLVTVEIPPNLLGFIFYLVVSQVKLCHIGCCGSIGCECSLETSQNERISITSFVLDKNSMLIHPLPFEFMTDHVFVWYDGRICKQIMELVKERRAISNGDPKLRFKFFTQTRYNQEAVNIKECGFRWICSFEEGGCKSERSREIHEVEANIVTNKVEGSQSNEQKETSNLKAEETEDLSYRLEEIMHIGFGGDPCNKKKLGCPDYSTLAI